MKYNKIYTLTAVFFLVVFIGFLCNVLFWHQPQSANALPMEDPLPVKADTTQALDDNNPLAAANIQAMEMIPEQEYQESDSKELLLTENSISENSIIEISPSDSISSSNSNARTMESDSDIFSSAAVSSDAILGSSSSSITGSSTSSITAGSSSSGTVSSGSSGSGSSASSGASSSGSSGSSGSGSSGAAGSNSSASVSTGSGAPVTLGSGAAGGSTSTSNILEELRKLHPLPKIHYTWGLGTEFIIDRDNPLLYEIARLTHSLSIVGESTPPVLIDNCVYTCARINKTDPAIPCSMAINYSPWHRKFMPEVPWNKYIPAVYNYTIFSNPTYNEEIEFFKTKMTNVKQWIAQSNQKYGSDVKISAILLDCERFYKRDKDTNWNEGMRKALDAIHVEAVKLFPDARIQWYGRGITRPDGNTWRETGLWTGNEIKSPLSCSLYMLPELEAMRETFRKTCTLADTFGIVEVTPYVALGSGYYRDPFKGVVWRDSWEYDVSYAYQMGLELNDFCNGVRPENYPPYNRAVVIDIYPDPFERTAPAWGKHFIAYCQGAANANKQ